MLLSAAAAADGRVRVYRDAIVVDGTGSSRFTADVTVERARIVAVGTAPEVLPAATIEVDARGLVLAPGFIDMHAHSDLAVLTGAEHIAKLRQGVTTEVLGQDGIGYAPIDDAVLGPITQQITGWNGPIADSLVTWRTMAEYLDTIDAATAGNAAVLVPQGNLRMLVKAYDPSPATPDELARMCEHLATALDAGAFGMSSGLTYAPGMYADTAELEALCRVLAERGGYWAPHTRSYGAGALEAYAEAIGIARRTGCALHLTHATMNFGVNRGRARELLDLVDAALADGVDLTLDTYPYLPGATTLAALLPSSWAAGGTLLERLRDASQADREDLRVLVDETGCDGFHGVPADWATIQISGVGNPALADLVGRTISEIAQERRARPIDVVVDVLIADELATGILMHVGDEDNVREIMRHDVHSGGSDGILVGARPHPRAHGTFARYLGHYSRDAGVLSLEETVRHLSNTPARRLGLHRGDAPRGVIRPGATADLVLFDPALVAAGSTFDAPRTAPVGFTEVLVGGVAVLEHGEPTGRTPGRALRKPPRAHRATVPRARATIDPHARGVRLDGVRLRSDTLDLAPAQQLLGAPREGGAVATVSIDGALAEEGYRVTVTPDGVHITGGDAIGAFRGAVLLGHLRDPDDPALPVPSGTWTSAPAHPWRGLMLDVARHFRPVADVCRLIDLLAWHGMNVLHLHLTDDQGWRYEVQGRPELTARGGVRSGTQRGHGPTAEVDTEAHAGWYTAADLRHIDAYAAARGVTVVPEVELPGHVQAALAADPTLGVAETDAPDEPWHRFGLNPHTLNLEDATLAFCRDAIDVLCDAFSGPYVGIGGDEVPTAAWAASDSVRARMADLGIATPQDIQPWFTAQLAAHVAARGKRAFAWDEVLAGPVPDDVVIAAWRGLVAAEVAIERGYACVVCPDTVAYLDYRQSDGADEPVPVGPPLTNADAWSFTVPDGAMGGQANVWTEHLRTRDEVDFAVFPRLAVIAERLWHGGEPGEWADFEAALPTHLRRLAAWGVRFRPLDGPTPAQRKPGVPGVPRTRVERDAIVAELVADLRRSER